MRYVNKPDHGDDCMDVKHCTCGAPVRVIEVEWKKGEPVTWGLIYDPPPQPEERT